MVSPGLEPPIRPCLRSGLCCKTGPCPFGEWDAARHQCRFLEEADRGDGWIEYRCGAYARIQALPPAAGATFAPAFGSGCCMPLFNQNRDALAARARENKREKGDTMIRLFHMNYDLPREERLALTFPMPVDGKTEKEVQAEAGRRLLQSGGYHLAATIDTDSLNEAWMLTSNGAASESWSQEPPPRVTPAEPGYIETNGQRYGYKSTEIGDVFELNGEFFMVTRMGHISLGRDLVPNYQDGPRFGI